VNPNPNPIPRRGPMQEGKEGGPYLARVNTFPAGLGVRVRG